MDKLAQAISTLKAENKWLLQELKLVHAAIAALQGITNSGRGSTTRLSGRTLFASARKTGSTSEAQPTCLSGRSDTAGCVELGARRDASATVLRSISW